MNFNAAAAFLLATASSVRAGPSGLRELNTNMGYSESLGACTGAKCGLWGDPHIDTCDGLIYDCQGTGIYTLMKNHAFNVQANFVNVSSSDWDHIIERGIDLPLGASLTNDVMIDFLLDDSPVFQFGFGDLSNHDGTFPAEEGCTVNWTYKPPNMPGTKKSRESNVEQCRQRCEETPGCTGFSYWSDSYCHVVDDTSELEESKPHWSRAVAGRLDSECGTHHPGTLIDVEERMKHGYIGKQCPLLMWEDGVMKDISGVQKNGFLYGGDGDPVTVELKKGKNIHLTYTMPDGDKAVIELQAKGQGPGELWSCHWDFWICLPETGREEFSTGTTGLLGSPDGDAYNDWMDTDGNTIGTVNEVINDGPDKHNVSMAYCYDNWCVPEEDSIMSYHGDTTYGDHMCRNETHRDFDVNDPACVLSADKIEEECGGLPANLLHACQMDCCVGGCGLMPDLDRPRAPTPAPAVDFLNDCVLANTPDTVCPTTTTTTAEDGGGGGGSIVKLLSTTGTQGLPDGAEVFHSIVQDPDPDDNGSTTVKFKLNNPFGSDADAYVKHDVNVLTTFTSSVCDGFRLDSSSCGSDRYIEVACKEFPGVEPFALVNVYFASDGISGGGGGGDAVIDRCCEAEEYGAGIGIVEYTFRIECTCPNKSIQ